MFYCFSFLFYSHSFLRPVESTVLNSETGNCNGSKVGHPSYTRFIFLRAKKKKVKKKQKEDSGKEMGKRHTNKKDLTYLETSRKAE